MQYFPPFILKSAASIFSAISRIRPSCHPHYPSHVNQVENCKPFFLCVFVLCITGFSQSCAFCGFFGFVDLFVLFCVTSPPMRQRVPPPVSQSGPSSPPPPELAPAEARDGHRAGGHLCRRPRRRTGLWQALGRAFSEQLSDLVRLVCKVEGFLCSHLLKKRMEHANPSGISKIPRIM